MAIPFSVIPRVDPRDVTLPRRFFAVARSSNVLTLRDLATWISSISTVTTIDTVAVLEAFLQVIPQELSNGGIVRLGEFGTLRSVLQSKGSDSEAEFDSSLISGVRVNFRPGKLVRDTLNTAGFTKVEE